jgi:hypothetical protein
VRYLIDTNIISETIKPQPNANVAYWLGTIPQEKLYLSVLTIGELHKGIVKLGDSKRKNQLIHWLEYDVPLFFEYNILSIGKEVADKWGYLSSRNKNALPVIEALLAATCLVHNLIMVTRNVKDFQIAELELINPFE